MADDSIANEKRKIYNWRPVNAGDVYGDWTIQGEGDPCYNGKGHATRRWVAKCICGEKSIFTSFALKNNKNKCRHGANAIRQDVDIGSRFGKLKTIGIVKQYKGVEVVPCVCECGTHLNPARSRLFNGSVTACSGCLYQAENANRKTDRITKHPNYAIWAGMKQRCNSPNNPAYPYYGGRGIRICDRWMNFKNFAEDMGVRPVGYSLERIDVNKGYSPENCVWADKNIQAINKQANHEFSVGGKTMTARQIEQETGLSYKWVCRQRSKSGMDGDAIIAKAIEALVKLQKP